MEAPTVRLGAEANHRAHAQAGLLLTVFGFGIQARRRQDGVRTGAGVGLHSPSVSAARLPARPGKPDHDPGYRSSDFQHSSAAVSRCLRALVNLALGKLRERLVGLLFLGESCLEQLHSLIETELRCPGL